MHVCNGVKFLNNCLLTVDNSCKKAKLAGVDKNEPVLILHLLLT
jgi:hypothetical protein